LTELAAVFERFMNRRLGEVEKSHASLAEHRSLSGEMARVIAEPI
jgi:hypothetical protein